VPSIQQSRWKRNATAIAWASVIWLLGFLAMTLPAGDGLLRLSYDWLYLFARPNPGADVVVIALNEDTDRKLGRRQGEAFSRSHHARLVRRLQEAGAERICYDILFDLPSREPGADKALLDAIEDHGRVILGGAREQPRQGATTSEQTVLPPVESFRNAAEGWGLLNIGPIDPDGVIRRCQLEDELVPPLAWVAANRARDGALGTPRNPVEWMEYRCPPSELPTYEFADCLDPGRVPDSLFRGGTVFVGGQYATDAYGRRDVFSTPYSRFGSSAMYGVEWHAHAFINARDQLWMQPANHLQNALWCLPFALVATLIPMRRRLRSLLALIGLVVVFVPVAVWIVWKSHVLAAWMVPALVQFPAALLGVAIEQIRHPKIEYRRSSTTAAGPAPNLFISFSTKDQAWADRLREALQKAGITAWVSSADIRAGSRWNEEIAKAIVSCEVFVFLFSQNSAQSPICANELAIANDTRKTILTIRLDESPIPRELQVFLAAWQELRITDLDKDTAVTSAVREVDSLLGSGPPESPVS
jgi:CHASE2 domain-containing sensor protein